jgi:hypothetical protein
MIGEGFDSHEITSSSSFFIAQLPVLSFYRIRGLGFESQSEKLFEIKIEDLGS